MKYGKGAAVDFIYKNQGRVHYLVGDIETETLMNVKEPSVEEYFWQKGTKDPAALRQKCSCRPRNYVIGKSC